MTPFTRLFRYAAVHRTDVCLATVYSTLNKLFDIAPEVLIGVVVDVVVNKEASILARFGISEPTDQVLALGILTFLIWVFESLFEFLYSIKWRNLAQSVQHELRMDAYAHVQHMNLSYFESGSTGGLLSVLNDDINQLERFLDSGANEIIQVVVSTLVIGGIFFYVSPQIAIFAMLPIPCILFGMFFFQRRLTPLYLAVRQQVSNLNARLANNITGIATIKSYVTEDYEIDKIHADSNSYRLANGKVIALSSAVIPIIRMAIMGGFIATLVLGGWLTLEGSLAVGSYSVLIFLTQRLLWPLTGLAKTVDLFERSMASATRVFDLLKVPSPFDRTGEPLPLKTIVGEIKLENVTFSYEDNRPVLQNISLHIPAGSTAAFVGTTGSGKSTLVKLLLRFYEPKQGRLLIDGRDIQRLNIRDLRQCIGFVSQEVFLFQGTVRENIMYGSFGAQMQDIEKGARGAEAHDFISALPEGYETIVGERGMNFSGGQRQRISIARALVKNPPLLILDEATSAVDNETEAAIQRSLESIAKGRTTLLIAHRLSTVRNADNIFVLEKGILAESGTHEELLAKNGVYASLWKVQTGERAH
jgi:ATP-binding cassette subfamily B protein